MIASERFSGLGQEHSLYSYYVSSTALSNILSFADQVKGSRDAAFGYLITSFLDYNFLKRSEKTSTHIEGQFSFQVVGPADIWLTFLNWDKIFVGNCLIVLAPTWLTGVTCHLNHWLDFKDPYYDSFNLNKLAYPVS